MYNILGFILFSALSIYGASLFASRAGHIYPPRLIYVAVGLRIFGATARYEVLERFYHGVGDAGLYFAKGWEIARMAWRLDLPLFSPWFWTEGGRWWGTPFMDKLSGLAVTLVGPSMRAEFLFFSLVSFAGLVAATEALRRVQPAWAVPYARLLWLWPSLWFWPSSVGKEAVVVAAMGLLTLAYVGRRGRTQWLLYAAALALAFAIRPHVAAVLALATAAAYWLGSWQRITPRRLLEGVAALLVFFAAFYGMRAQFGLGDVDLEGMREFVEYRAAQTVTGDSSIEAVPVGPSGLILAFVNIWMRPFPWEFHNLTSLFAAIEILLLWAIIVRRRRSVVYALRHWRDHPLLRFAAPLLFGYTVMIGLTFANLGIIARQRSPMFIFLFMVLFAAPSLVARRRPRAPIRAAAHRRRAA